MNQCRSCAKREELQATLTGAAIYKQPVTLTTLMKGFTGRYYKNITGETPSRAQQQDDMTAAEVLQEPRSRKRQAVSQRDRKRKKEDATEAAVEEKRLRDEAAEELRRGEEAGEENSSEKEDVQRRKKTDVKIEGSPIPPTPAVFPEVPHEQVEGVSEGHSGNQCAVETCTQPGGHVGPHEDIDGRKFAWSAKDGRIPLEEEDDDNSSTSFSSSTSSEELALTPRRVSRNTRGKKKEKPGVFMPVISKLRKQTRSSSCSTPGRHLFGFPRKWLRKEKSKSGPS